MAVILDFLATRAATRDGGGAGGRRIDAGPAGCEIVIFPGVRIVRHAPPVPPGPPRPPGPRGPVSGTSHQVQRAVAMHAPEPGKAGR